MLRCFFRFLGRRSASQNRKRSGSTAVEMALIAPVFFMLMIGVTELSLMLTAQQLIENASYNASRLAKTGYISAGQTQAQTVLKVVTDELSSFGSFFTTSKISTTATAYTSFSGISGTGTGTTGYGTEQQIVVYTITYPWTIFTPMIGQLIGTWDQGTNSYIVNLTTRIVVRNEPYG